MTRQRKAFISHAGIDAKLAKSVESLLKPVLDNYEIVLREWDGRSTPILSAEPDLTIVVASQRYIAAIRKLSDGETAFANEVRERNALVIRTKGCDLPARLNEIAISIDGLSDADARESLITRLLMVRPHVGSTNASHAPAVTPKSAKRRQVLVGIDGGATKIDVKIVAIDSTDAVTASNRDSDQMGGTNIHDSGATPALNSLKAVLKTAFMKAKAKMGPDIEVVGICMGTAGIDAEGDKKRYREVFGEALSIGLREFGVGVHVDINPVILSDIDIIAWCSEAPICLSLIAGTGSNCVAIKRGNPEVSAYCGGLDLQVSDDGSAAWIAHEAFRVALKVCNGIIENTKIGEQICKREDIKRDELHGDRWWRRLKEARQNKKKHELAAFARDVVSPLAEEGDEVAENILHQAADDLYLMAHAALRRVGVASEKDLGAPLNLNVLLVGGVWQSKIIRSRFSEKLHAAYGKCLIKDVDPTDGAIMKARKTSLE